MAKKADRWRPTRSPAWLRAVPSVAITAGVCLGSSQTWAQYVPGQFPTGVPGYGEELGVTVVSRVRPLYVQRGARFGDLILHANLDESLGYNSNVIGLHGGKGSPVIESNPSLELNSDWSRNALGARVSADDYQYPSDTSQSHTDWTAAIGGGYTIGRSNLTLSYAHLKLHESPTYVGAPASTTPIPYNVDDTRISYPFELGRLQVTPNFEASFWRYGEATIGGAPTNESFLDTNEYRGGAAFSYALTGATSLILTAQAIRSDFVRAQAGTPSLSSTSELLLGGIDYQYDGIWRYQALVGVEVREFDASQFHTQTAPIVRAAVIWTPTELTTVTATLLRAIQDPTQVGTSGYTYTATELRVDHEYAGNLLLHGRVGAELASYLQNGGTQAAVYAGLGATWLINRHMRLSAAYTYTTQNKYTSEAPIDGGLAAMAVTPGYNQNLFLVILHFGL